MAATTAAVGEAFADENLPRLRQATKACGEVQCTAAVATIHRHSLARIETHAHSKGKGVLGLHALDEAMLKSNGGAYPVSGGAEDDERLVPTDLDESAARALDDVLDDLGEGGSKASGRLVAVLLGVPRVAADVGDQEGPDPGFRRRWEWIFESQGRSALFL